MLSRRDLIIGIGAGATVVTVLGAVWFSQRGEQYLSQSLLRKIGVENSESRIVTVDGWMLLAEDLQVVDIAPQR